MRRAGRELLSLALIDARNHTLRWLAACEAAPGPAELPAPLPSPLWLAGQVGWFQEAWIARNVQRSRGLRWHPARARLASILPGADAWYDDPRGRGSRRGPDLLPDAQTTRQYLVDTLEVTLDLLEQASEDDDGLYFYRCALFHEDRCGERFAELAQALGIDGGPVPPLAALNPREPLVFPATTWTLGSAGAGFIFDDERAAHAVAVPEFEIDAQPVCWDGYAEFVEDGGYDARGFWSEPGWAWLQHEGRRVPRHVDQLRHGVLQQRFGKLIRVPAAQPALHVSGHEAEAWCRWAGRRLPTEVEWEAAAHLGGGRGFRWGDVWEWTATGYRAYPGHVAGPLAGHRPPFPDGQRVLRGASFATSRRLRHPKVRRSQEPQCDDAFSGFRSCAI